MKEKTPRRLLYALKDAEMKGGLEKYLRRARDEGKSFVTISEELSKKGAPVGKSTVYDWLAE